MRPVTLLAALATAVSAQLQINFTDPAPDAPISFAGDTINIQWTIPADSKYSALNNTAALFFKGPRDLEYRIAPLLSTGLGVTGQRWDLKEFKDEMYKLHNFTREKEYYFELQFTSVEGVEQTGKHTVEGVEMGPGSGSGAERASKAGWAAALAVAGAAVVMAL
ncbi:hypothetical protein QBC34DRAFT_478273 [Podospora aff. communis PSN243]|uniref:Uncharacterized protein n=1 Tax=Podospora aff. communis PSN243 TaxID=3040156 RepID=A0AAV9G6X1_9PEZI|nr:hypothetical protein QBC34DRAFT_478273 [Podospora aff. communis PSN243]